MSNLAEKIRLARERGLEGDDLKVLLKKRKLNYEKKKPRKEKQEDVIRKKKSQKNRSGERGETVCTRTGKAEVGI